MTSAPAPRPVQWLWVTVSSAGAPASLRVTVWRRLRGLGALYLQSSVCLLPDRPPVARELRRLADRVRREGGSMRVLAITLVDPAEEAEIVEQFRAAVDAEYAEVVSRTPAMLEEIVTELAAGRASYPEVEESEADLERFRTWLAKIEARDYFAANGRAAAQAAVARCAAELEAFEAAAFAAEPAGADLGTAGQRLDSGTAAPEVAAGDAADEENRPLRLVDDP